MFGHVFHVVTNIILGNQSVLYDQGQVFEFLFQTVRGMNVNNQKTIESAVFYTFQYFVKKYLIDILVELILSYLRKQQHLLFFFTVFIDNHASLPQ